MGGTGEETSHGPVRGLEDLGELLVDRGRHSDLEPAECCGQRERLKGQELPFVAPASQRRGGRHHSCEHAQQRAERHDHAKSPHDDHTPTPRATTVWPVAGIILRPPKPVNAGNAARTGGRERLVNGSLARAAVTTTSTGTPGSPHSTVVCPQE